MVAAISETFSKPRRRSVSRSGEDEAASGFGERRRLLEEFRIMALNAAQMAGEHFGEFRSRIEAREAGDMIEPLAGRGQRMRLLVSDHLEAMLECAEEAICGLQLVGRFRRDPLLARQLVQHEAGLLAAQVAVAAARDQLLRLHEEFDFADAAAAELDVVTGDRDGAVTADGVDLALHRVNVVDGGEVEILAPDIGRQHFQEAIARTEISGNGAGLDEGRALPVLPAAFIVMFGGGQRDGDGRAAGVGAQAQIGAEDITVFGAFLHQLHECLRQAHEKLAVAETGFQRQVLRLVKDDEIDVARIIELARAVFAHAENGETAAFRRHVLGRTLDLAALRRVLQQPLDARLDGRVGEGGERVRHFFERPEAGHVRHGDEKRGFLLGDAQRAHDLGLGGEPRRVPRPRKQGRQHIRRRIVDQP